MGPHSRCLPLCLIGLVLFVANAFLIRELFAMVYPASMYSIEAAYVGLARHYMEAGLSSPWFPYWYGGLPTVSTYPPLLHLMVAAAGNFMGMEPAHAYHAVTAFTYCLVPVALFSCAWVMSGQYGTSTLVGLASTLLSPSAMLLAGPFHDLGGWQYPRRLQTLFKYGEGPHVTSLMWIFVAAALLHKALETRQGGWRVLATLALAATALTNSIGAAGLVIVAVAYIAARPDVLRARPWRDAALLGVLAYLLAAPLLPPSTLAAIRQNAPLVGGVYEGSLLTYSLLLLHVLAGGLAAYGLRAFGASLLFRFSVAALIPLLGITASPTLYGFSLLPQSERYHLEMELVLILAVVAAGAFLTQRLQPSRWIRVGAVVLLCVCAVLQVRSTRFYVRNHIHGGVVEETIEYQSAQWFRLHLPHDRVFVPGSISFWLHAFTDTPQFGGGYDNGVANPNYLALSYQIYSGEGAGEREAHIAITWLKAFGVRAVQVVYPESPEVFHPYRNPSKFEGVLEEIWRHRDSRVYRVPARGDGLAYVIPEASIARFRPENGLSIEEAERYVQALEDARLPESQWQWLSPSEARVRAATEAGQVISVQVAFHPGWEALSNATPVTLEADGLGQVILKPPPGNHDIRLVFTGGMEHTIMMGLFAAGMLLCGWLILADRSVYGWPASWFGGSAARRSG